MERPAQGIDAVRAWLDERGVAYEVIEHEETFTAVDDARAAGVPFGFAAKTLVLHDRDAFLLAVIPASRRLDERRARCAARNTAPPPRHGSGDREAVPRLRGRCAAPARITPAGA